VPDRTLTCRDCQQEFTFTEGEQQFFAQRGFTEPTRCAECRRKRKMERDADAGGYGGGGYGGGDYGGGGRGGGRGYGGGGGGRRGGRY
jgi:hypothetical protein